jgi:hypothetical protein
VKSKAKYEVFAFFAEPPPIFALLSPDKQIASHMGRLDLLE